MPTKTAAKPNTTLEHIADKLARYKLRLVKFSDDLDVVELRPDDPRDKSDPIIMELCWQTGHDGKLDGKLDGWKYHGPPWKKHHEEYYALAAAEWLIGKRGTPQSEAALTQTAAPSPVDEPLPKITGQFTPTAFLDFDKGGWEQHKRDADLGITMIHGAKTRNGEQYAAYFMDGDETQYNTAAEFTIAYWKAHPERLAEARGEKTSPVNGSESPVPLPPSGPPCPSCGRVMTYEQAYVGGRGYCWRRRCPGLDDFSCDHIERWV